MKKALPTSKLITVLLAAFLTFNIASAAVEPIPTGSFIVNMGVVPQTYANGIKPWGMVYDLIHNYKVQVKWIISQSKAKDGTDFTYNGTNYKGGTFIIISKYRSAAVNARITYWQTQGIIGATTTSDFTADVTYTLKYTPRWTFDFQNGSIALNYLDIAGIPTAQYPKKNPADLNDCDDLFVMPHADPTWDTHKNLYYWNKNTRGWIWDGCHATSVMESLVNPLDSTEQMNFLSQKGLVMYNNHSNPTPPYSYRYPNDAEMQFMGIVDGAMQNGSEQVFLPLLNSTWRPTSKVGVYDPTQVNIPSLSPGDAGIIVYGRAFGDNSRGEVMYEAGHSLDKGNADAVSAIRAFFNFSFLSVYDKEIIPTISGPSTVNAAESYSYTATLPAGYDPANYSFHWYTACNGTFSNTFGQSTNYTPGPVAACGPCTIWVTVTDGCGREYYQSVDLNGICPVPPVALDRTANLIINPPGTGPKAIFSMVPMAGTDADGYVVNYVMKSLPSTGVLSYDNDNNPATADVNITSLPGGELVLTGTQMKSLKYDPLDGFGGSTSFLYTVTDNSGLRDLTPATYTIPVNPPPVTSSFVCTPVASNGVLTPVCPMKATDNGTVVSYTIVTLPPTTACTVYLNGEPLVAGQVLTPAQSLQLTYKPSGTYVGYAEITYTATDNDGAFDSKPATLTLQMVNQPPVLKGLTAPVINNLIVQTNLPSLSATDADGTVISYTVTNAPASSQGILYYNNNGVYTQVTDNKVLTLAQAGSLKFQPSANFVGLASFNYTATDNGGLTNNSPVAFDIPVKMIYPKTNDVSQANSIGSLGYINIANLSGSTADNTKWIAGYKVTSLPSTSQGILKYHVSGNDYQLVSVNQVVQSNELRLEPVSTYIGNVAFNYAAVDNTGLTDPSPATAYTPIVNASPVVSNVTSYTVKDTSGLALIKPLVASDADGSIISFSIRSLPDPATGILYYNGVPVILDQQIPASGASSLKFKPALHNSQDATFKYTATDNMGAIDVSFATFTIPVSMVTYLTAPVANGITIPSISTKPVVNSLLPLNGTDQDGVIVQYQVTSLPSDGTLYFIGIAVKKNQFIPASKADQLTYIPSGTFKGTVNFKYNAIDNDGLSSPDVTYNIPVVNTLPVAIDQTISAVKKGATSRIPGLNASDADGTIASYRILSLPSMGTLQYDSTGTGVYATAKLNQVLTPARAATSRYISMNMLGSVSFTFSAKDNLGDTSNVATYIIPVASNSINQQPLVNDITSAPVVPSSGAALISPLSGTDIDGTIASYAVITIPPAYYGTLYYNSSGTIYDSITVGYQVLTLTQAATLKFRPSGLYIGNVSFKFRAFDNDGDGAVTDALFTIPIINPAPVCPNITNASMPSTSGPVAITPLSATSAIAISKYIITSLPDPSQGTLILDGSPVVLNQEIGVLNAGRLEFAPNPSFTGNAVFNYTAVDVFNAVDQTPATFTIQVTNTAPFADDKLSQVMTNQLGTPAQNIPDLTGSDPDGSVAKFYIKTLPSGGVLYVNGNAVTSIPVGGFVVSTTNATKLSFDPNDNYSGATSFTYTVQDNTNNLSATATYQIIVNAPPVTFNITSNAFYPGQQRAAIPSLQGTDDGTVAFWSIITLPDATDGVLYLGNVPVTNLAQVDSLSAAQIATLSFQPLTTFDGTIFTYTATDNLGVIDVTPAVYNIPLSSQGGFGVLPVGILSFSGNKTGSDNQLRWSVNQQQNTDHYEIERSADGISFEKVGAVNATAGAATASDYSLVDKNVQKSYYYRLRIVDHDNNVKISDVILIKRTAALSVSRITPNPFRDNISLELEVATTGTVSLSIFDINGKVLKAMEVTVAAGANHLVISSLDYLPSGTYILKVRNADAEKNIKLYKGN